MKSHSSTEVKFPYQKLQRMWLTEPLDDNPDAYNRIVIRYTDALLVIPARLLRNIPPTYGLTRADTQEHDFNVHFMRGVHIRSLHNTRYNTRRLILCPELNISITPYRFLTDSF